MNTVRTKISGVTLALGAVLTVSCITLQPAHAQTGSVLYSFGAQPDGAYPRASLIMDTKGNFYGTTYQGGANGEGTVFELTAAGEESVLYSFGAGSGDGNQPDSSLLLYKGDFYGTSYYGGVQGPECLSSGCGTVFKLSPKPAKGCPAGSNAGNGMCETVLYTFGSLTSDGVDPYAGLIVDEAGNLYGTTVYGGNDDSGAGTVFELSREPAGGCPTGSNPGNGWCETVLYTFLEELGADGQNPNGGVIIDKAGNLYGTTLSGGKDQSVQEGTVFELSPEPVGGCAAGSNTGNGWCETVLYSFGSQSGDGANPYAGVVMDSRGNLYGTTSQAGAGESGGGTVFEVTPAGAETVLWSFGELEYDGCTPFDGVIDSKGHLYGTTWGCGQYGLGMVFEMSPPAKRGGPWSETKLYAFPGAPGGQNPAAGLVMNKDGNLFGTTEIGGANGNGTVFEVTP
jgi:uncharacterized repeat protein (TIGR03803 family)